MPKVTKKVAKKVAAKKIRASKTTTAKKPASALTTAIARLEALLQKKEQKGIDLSQTDITNATRPTLSEMKRLLVAARYTMSTLSGDEQVRAAVAREQCWDVCHFCDAPSHPSMREARTWAGVTLCPCLTQTAPAPRKDAYREELGGWAAARTQPDGGISWLKTRVNDGGLDLSSAVYSDQCRCGERFTIRAGTIRQTVIDHNLTTYKESKLCFPCGRAAAKRRAAATATVDTGESVGVVRPKKSRKKRGELGTLADLAGAAGLFAVPAETEAA